MRNCRSCPRYEKPGRLYQKHLPALWRRYSHDCPAILLDAYAANNVNFQTDYDKRLEKIGDVIDGCSLMLQYLQLCTEDGIISVKKSGIWTKKGNGREIPGYEVADVGTRTCRVPPAGGRKKRLYMLVKALRAALAPPDPEEKKQAADRFA